jgi:hypothetical protein
MIHVRRYAQILQFTITTHATALKIKYFVLFSNILSDRDHCLYLLSQINTFTMTAGYHVIQLYIFIKKKKADIVLAAEFYAFIF